MILSKIVNKVKSFYYKSTSERYLNFLRSKGVRIGANCFCPNPKSLQIDFSRPSLLEIGSNVRLNQDLTIMTHDYASMVFVNLFHEFIPSHRKISIGNNVYFGRKCTVLKGVTIGDNCIIGYGSVVMKDIPANSVAAGSPAKVICSIDDYFKKRQKQYVTECVEYTKQILNEGREPTIQDFFDDYILFTDGNNYQNYQFPYHNVFDSEQFECWKKNHKRMFDSFEEFIQYVKTL